MVYPAHYLHLLFLHLPHPFLHLHPHHFLSPFQSSSHHIDTSPWISDVDVRRTKTQTDVENNDIQIAQNVNKQTKKTELRIWDREGFAVCNGKRSTCGSTTRLANPQGLSSQLDQSGSESYSSSLGSCVGVFVVLPWRWRRGGSDKCVHTRTMQLGWGVRTDHFVKRQTNTSLLTLILALAASTPPG